MRWDAHYIFTFIAILRNLGNSFLQTSQISSAYMPDFTAKAYEIQLRVGFKSYQRIQETQLPQR